MRRFRFSIAGLLGVILFVAVGLAALRSASAQWDGAVFGVTLLILTTSILVAIYRDQARRAFWIGFALFGWVYLAASLIPPVEARLPTTGGLVFLDAKRSRLSPSGMAFADVDADGKMDLLIATRPSASTTTARGMAGEIITETIFGYRTPMVISGSTAHFLRIGHSLLALLIACLGGLVSRRLRASSAPRPTPARENGPAAGNSGLAEASRPSTG
jgi:hypothetical protein